ncbi:hypothetical protein [Coprothermobacter proteolyticus]|uniref:hypothetical protein n=1 Tax=Coprothermobacter proteolyticus TaxID=35786 RepID=UPI000D324241|nr:hypothetical protein [Coprothermobacter proteolyticus]
MWTFDSDDELVDAIRERYSNFGLREEWMTSFLNLGEDYLRNNTLGPKQKTALNEYLRDAGFIERNRKSTELCDVVRFGYSLGSLPVLSVWAIVWTNLCHNSGIFLWWANQPPGNYTRESMLQELRQTDKRERTLTNITNSLISTLQSTPIGKDLRQGEVIKSGRSRIVQKIGHPKLNLVEVIYAFYMFARKHEMFSISIEDMEPYVESPQKIFCITSAELADVLGSSKSEKLFKVTWTNDKVYLDLDEGLNEVDVLKMCISTGGG